MMIANPVNRVRRLALPATLVLVALWGIAYLSWPMAGDHGQLALVGDVIRSGGMPYRDAWTMKGPVALYGFAGIQVLFGRAMWSVRAFDLLTLAVGTWAVFRGVRRFTGGRAALWTATVFVLSYASLRYMNTAQPDGWAGVLLALAFVPLLGRAEVPAAGLRIWGGALIGCATLIKPFYGIFLLVPVLDAMVGAPRSWRQLWPAGAWTTAGFLLPIAVTAGWFAAHGALGSLIDVHLIYASRVYTPQFYIGLQHRLDGLLQLALSKNPPALAGAIAGAHVLWRQDRRSAAILLTWVLLGIIDVTLAGRFYPYHWLPVFPPLAVLAGVGFGSLLAGLAEERSGLPSGQAARAFTMAVGGLALLLAAYDPARAVARWGAYCVGQRNAAEYYGTFIGGGATVPVEDMKAADYIRMRTRMVDVVGIWGENTLILYLANRRSPSRFNWTWPLVLGEETTIQSAYRAEYLTAVRQSTPRYFIVGTDDSFHNDNDVWAQARMFPELHEFLHARYHLEATFGKIDLFRRSNDSTTTSN